MTGGDIPEGACAGNGTDLNLGPSNLAINELVVLYCFVNK